LARARADCWCCLCDCCGNFQSDCQVSYHRDVRLGAITHAPRPFSYRRCPECRGPSSCSDNPKLILSWGVVLQTEGPVVGDELNAVRNLLNRHETEKARRRRRGDGGQGCRPPKAWFAFGESDARKFGDAVQAESTDTYSGWASQRAFELPVTKLAALEASLPAPRDNPRQIEAAGPRLSRRPRGGPRLPFKRYDEE
jgi:hypothetical protein